MINKYIHIFIIFFVILINPKYAYAVDLSSTTPADNATQIAVNTGIDLVWLASGSVSTNNGNVILKKTSDDSTVETFSTNGMFLAMSLSAPATVTATFTLSSNLDDDTEYYILVDSTAFNNFDGISSKTELNFKTVDNNNPTITSSSPSDDASNVSVSSNIVLTFNEVVDVESGNIDIINTSTGEVIEIDVTGSLLSGSGTTEITINPSSDLENDTSYHVKIDSTAFDDVVGNSYPGISNTTTLNFTTAKGQIFNDTVKTLLKNQTTASIQSMTQSLNRVNSRLNFIRPIQNSKTSRNKIALNFNDPYANKLVDVLTANLIKYEKKQRKFAFWSEGNLSFGRINNKGKDLGQDLSTKGFTVGFDKKITDLKTIGLALNQSEQETQIGSNDAHMDATAKSLLIYGSNQFFENRYFEAAIGFGETEIDINRKVSGGNNKGLRDGKQLFGSFTYLYEPLEQKENKNLNYYSRIDLGYTILEDYIESGDGDSINYNDQNIKSSSLSFGFNFSNIIEIDQGFITPLIQFEIGKNKTINSLSEA
ncbi:Ig-like domain-containing protein [Candidatus Pelagibacter sp.]|nr:Ig-like domain-containing protein [Candidatus Pelagibacter sp.]